MWPGDVAPLHVSLRPEAELSERDVLNDLVNDWLKKKLVNECLFAFFLFSVNDNGATLLESQRNRVIVLSPNWSWVRTALISGCRTAGFVVCDAIRGRFDSLLLLYMQWDCGRLGCPKGETLSFRKYYWCLPFGAVPLCPLTFFFLPISCFFSVQNISSEALDEESTFL